MSLRSFLGRKSSETETVPAGKDTVNVLFAASECVPFVKTGGLADVVGSLPQYLDHDRFDVRVMLPGYTCIPEEYRSQMKLLEHFDMDYCGRPCYVGILELSLNGITYYFIDNLEYFTGDRPYTDDRYDLEKFCFFSKAVLSSLPVIGFRPDVIHCHDWQTALIPVLSKRWGLDEFYASIKTVMTIHNLRFQGVWDIGTVMYVSELDGGYFTSDKLEAWNQGNLLKGGIAYADIVTTVSPTYAAEITGPMGGEGLDGLLRARGDRLKGILNGIDYRSYDPVTDESVYRNFDARMFGAKLANKLAFQKEHGLTEDPDALMIGIVSRLTGQKGFDLIRISAEDICSGYTQLVVLGTGEYQYESMFRELKERHPDSVSVTIGYSEELSRKIYASCDAFLMPSQFEPCGLSQLIAMRYGTLPIVRETGGLKDTVEPYNEFEDTGTGFSFSRYDAGDMMNIVNYAKNTYHDHHDAWVRMAKRAMSQDFSWESSARHYEDVYRGLTTDDE